MAWTDLDDTLDVLTETEAKAAARIQGTADDARLAELVTAVSRRLDELVGPIVQRSVTGERHNGGGPTIVLRQRPAQLDGLTVVEYRATSSTSLTVETAGTQPAAGVIADPWHGLDPTGALTNGVIRRRAGGWDDTYWPGRLNIVATYTAGRYATTAAVDPLFKRAARLMVQNLWRAETPTVAQLDEYDVPGRNVPTFSVPRAVRELLRHELVEIPEVA